MKVIPTKDVDGVAFDTDFGTMLHLKNNGDIFVKGKKAAHDREVVKVLVKLIRDEPKFEFYSIGWRAGFQVGFMAGSLVSALICVILSIIKIA